MTAEDVLATSLQYLKGVGPKRAADLEHAGLQTVEDLLYRFPIRYEDRSRLQPIASLKPGRPASIAARILSCGLRSTRRPGFKIFEALIADDSGPLRAVWLNQPYLRDVFVSGQQVVFYGVVEARAGAALQLTNPQYEILDDEEGETIHTGRIVPVYEKTGSVTPKIQRRLVHEALDRLPAELPDHLPEELRLRLRLPARHAALVAAHFPPADASIEDLNRFATPAQRRLIFEEAFLFQIGVFARRQAAAAERKASVIGVDDRIRESARRVLTFRLTAGQKTALKEIVDDLQRPQPMNRLLQGDVGAGRPSSRCWRAGGDGKRPQVAFMAPTEILAEQHFRTSPASRHPLRVALLTGSTTAAGKDSSLRKSKRAVSSWPSARTRWSRATCASSSSGWSSSTRARFGVMQRATRGPRDCARRPGDDGDTDPRTLA